ncbi:MAG: hypothetical protein EOO07_28415 [Chitinophagaceae bacterium]|nr:MAG: hypothetical protein EOO07_28415 [Chitinophagaceae bacterium]
MITHINTNAAVTISHVGNENTPVICMDDFLLDLDFLKQHAVDNAQFYKEPKSSYPGLRAALPLEFLRLVSSLIAQPIRNIFHIPDKYHEFVARSDYSLITSPPEILRPVQKIPHADSARIGDFAILLYVNDGDFGGTSFYRHKATGIELRTDYHEKRSWNSVNRFIHEYENKNIGFINGSDAHYERISGIAYKANRLVIYPTTLLHSGDLTLKAINDDPITGRLTMNVMMVFA